MQKIPLAFVGRPGRVVEILSLDKPCCWNLLQLPFLELVAQACYDEALLAESQFRETSEIL